MKDDLVREAKALKFVAILGVICMLALVFPLYSVANRADPFVLGLPFSMFWIVLVIAVEFVGFIAAYRWEYKGR
ncbi:MAG: hypothetical protein WD024_03945 [Bacillota bacterium]